MRALRKTRLVLGVALLLGSATDGVRGQLRGAEFQTLLGRVPGNANAMVSLDVEGIFASALGKAEDWQRTYTDNYAASPLIVPPASLQFILAADFELATMRPRWQVGSVELQADRTVEEILKVTGGRAEQLSGVDIVWPSEQACIARFAPREFGLIFPANAQLASSWVRRAKQETSGPSSPYLQSVARYAAQRDAQVVLGLDLTHAIPPAQIRTMVRNSDILRTLDEDKVVRVLESIQGLTFGVRIRDKIHGSLLVNFKDDTSVLHDVAKDVITNVLKKNGAMIPDLESWQAKVDGNYVVLSGEFSTPGMRQLFSIISLDTSILSTGGDAPAANERSNEDKQAVATLRYFRSISKHLDDLQKPRQRGQLSDVTLWLETYARKIERLPVGQVDPEMAAYGRYVAESFRYIVDTIQYAHTGGGGGTTPVVPKIRVTAVPTANVNNYGGYRVREYVPMVSAEFDVAKAQQQAEERAAALGDAEQAAEKMLDEVDSETQSVRTKMSSRYQREF